MALKVMEVYKILPKTNCKDCGLPTCMAFAMQVSAQQKALTDCPHVSQDAKTQFSESSTPPMKLVKIGAGPLEFKVGQETVLFRHDEKFHNPTGIAARIPAALSDADLAARIETVNKSVYERVGAKLKVRLLAVELDGCADPVKRAKAVADKAQAALILFSSNPATLKAAAEAVKAQKPLIGKATPENADKMIEVAAALKLPLAVAAPTLEAAADITKKAKEKGVEEMVLCVDGSKPGDAVRTLTRARRAALQKGMRPLGFPVLVDIHGVSWEQAAVLAATYAVKYAGILVLDHVQPEVLTPVLTAIQDVYTDPQVPNAVEAKLYTIGSPNENSPVLFTTNFSLTYFSVAGEVERSKIPAYICVIATEGLGVLNAYAGDKISAEKVVKTIKEFKVAEKVKHRKLIIPGLLPIFRAEIEESSEWKEVIIGPENSRGIPALLAQHFKG